MMLKYQHCQATSIRKEGHKLLMKNWYHLEDIHIWKKEISCCRLYGLTYRIIGNKKCHIVTEFMQFLVFIGEAVSCEVNQN